MTNAESLMLEDAMKTAIETDINLRKWKKVAIISLVVAFGGIFYGKKHR